MIMALGEWAVRWKLAEPELEDVDPRALTWWMHLRVDEDRLPDHRVVIEFDYQVPRIQFWIVLDRGDVSVCAEHPGFDSDLVVRTDALSMARVFNGLTTLGHAVDHGSLELLGPPGLSAGSLAGSSGARSSPRSAVARRSRPVLNPHDPHPDSGPERVSRR